MMNNNITVITVTYNNASGLAITLSSLLNLSVKPFEIIIIDGKSSDNTISVIKNYAANLRIRFLSEPDDGIYFAMNKGLKMVTTDLVHYLNGGDEVSGEPYLDVEGPILLPVIIKDKAANISWNDRIKLAGYGYCHQGIIFPASHRAYNTQYRIASDLDLIISVFPKGLHKLNISNSGSAIYYLDGFSSINNIKGDLEIIKIFRKKSGILQFIFIFLYIHMKSFLPRKIRRRIMEIFA